MIKDIQNWGTESRQSILASLIVVFALSAPTSGLADIVWAGDFETGNFMQWHTSSDANVTSFWQLPHYGAPVENNLQPGEVYAQTGDGSLASIVSSPAREGSYAARFTVKNSINGSETADCDNSICSRRRTVLTVQQTLPNYYDAMPYQSERWMSISVFLPTDWEEKRSGWGPAVFSVKPLKESGSSGLSASFGIAVEGSSWRIDHRWSPVENPTMADVPWQQSMFYTNDAIGEGGGPYPRSDFWSQGLEDYPDVAASQAALGSLNKGGWTDWIVHTRFDARGSNSGGRGFLTVWKREDSGPWVKVLHILPKQITRGGVTFDRGIGYNSPAGTSHNGGFGIKAGMYMDKDQVWGNSRNRVLYLDNIKVGDEMSSFTEMSPDGSQPGSPGDVTKVPLPPADFQVSGL